MAPRITAADARERVADAFGPDSVADEPMYVHDGPPGREAWLLRVRDRDGATRLVFVTAAQDGMSAPRTRPDQSRTSEGGG